MSNVLFEDLIVHNIHNVMHMQPPMVSIKKTICGDNQKNSSSNDMIINLDQWHFYIK